VSEEENPFSKQDQLAFAIAQDKSVALWARGHQVPRSTAHRWADDPKLRRMAKSCRRTLGRSISRMARRVARLSDQIAKLDQAAESESVELRALRSIVSDIVAVSKKRSGTVGRCTLRAVSVTIPDPFFEYRMAELEEVAP